MFLVFLLLTSIGLSSCRKDVDNFVGTYNARDTWVVQGQSYYWDYSFSITASAADGSKVLLNGLGDFQGVAIEAVINNLNLTIPQQTFTIDGASYGISGSGSINGVDLSIAYALQGLNTVNVTCTATRL